MMLTLNEFPDTPFEPGRPVSPSNFKGWKEDCIKIIRYLTGVIKNGIPEHFFITGKRGMGKTSFIQYVCQIAEYNFQMTPIHFNNSDGTSIEELILKLIEKLREEFDKGHKNKNALGGFLKRINEIKVGGTGFSLEQQHDLINDIKSIFQNY